MDDRWTYVGLVSTALMGETYWTPGRGWELASQTELGVYEEKASSIIATV